MNLSTRRLSEGDLKDWCLDKQNNLWVLRVSDKFGDSGLVGIISLVCRQNEAQILDFVLSCRVMGRKIEEAMVNLLWKFARDAQCNQLWAEFIQTAKNMPCFDFWQKSGFVFQSDSNRFIWDMNYEYQRPSSIKIESTLL
jgi:FkbH-like protein